ncbi:MAG: exopolyphosphatase, partial [Actinomycetes bacterium]
YDRYAIHLSKISLKQVQEVSDFFLSLDRESRSKLGYMHPGRVDVIAAGSLVLRKALEATGATSFIASESDILDGMAWKLSEESS